MKEITIAFEQPQVKINGIVFDLQKGDIDIWDRALQMQKDYASLSGKDPGAVLAAVKEVCGFIDQILGKGAMAKLAKGRPISIHTALNAMVLVCRAAMESYAERVKDELDG